MRQIIQHYRNGKLSVEEVPQPILRPGGVLVRNHYSVISAGTERAKVEVARASLLGKARRRPDLVRQVIDSAKREGLGATYRKVTSRLDAPEPLGYSCAGVVLEAALDADGLRAGDRVACAGGGYANHADVLFVPRNLCVRIPDSVSFEQAAYTTLGSIALHGVHQADCKLGEHVVVIGLGLVGQLTVQILAAAGINVIGIDIAPQAVALAKRHGANVAFQTDAADLEEQVLSHTGGLGADAVIITASTPSSEPIELAAELAGDRRRIVVLGAVGTDLPRLRFYDKELEIKWSRSYGPGRYDPQYEEHGEDYPVSYVRWTVKRNMEQFLAMLDRGQVDTDALTTHRFSVDEAQEAYQLLTTPESRPIGILLSYPESETLPKDARVWVNPKAPQRDHERSDVRIGLLGAGSFAKSVLLPNLKRDRRVTLRGVMTASGLTAQSVAKQHSFAYCASSAEEIAGDPEIDCVIIATRHDTHAALAVQALEQGKAVFVEKPLALTVEELRQVTRAQREHSGLLMVGFNRRFSPFTLELQNFFEGRAFPLMLNYRVNAGPLPAGHWHRDAGQGGGRLLGEAAHFIDLLSTIVGSSPVSVFAVAMPSGNGALPEDATITLRFADGSVGTVSYVCSGDTALPKERLEVFGGGTAAVIEDFRAAGFFRGGKQHRMRRSGQAKGHKEELDALITALITGDAASVRFEQSVRSTLATMRAVESIAMGTPLAIDSADLADAEATPKVVTEIRNGALEASHG